MPRLYWNTDPSLLGGLLLLAGLYRWLVGPLRARLAPTEPFPVRSVMWMDLFLVTFYLAVGSPLDGLGDRFLFSAHMLQHAILIFVLPLMFLAGLPPWLVDGVLGRQAPLRRALGVLTGPVVALFIFNVAFNFWHVPPAYEWALRDRSVHEVEHLIFLVSAILMWWPVVSPSQRLPRLPSGSRMLYLFMMSVTQIPLFGFLAFTGAPLYPTYEAAPRFFGIDAMEDQVLGAVVMKAGGEVFFVTYLLLGFLEWYRREGRSRRRRAASAH